MAASESARERDVYKYYQPWLDVSSLPSVPVEAAAIDKQPEHVPHASHDKTLTALAQLAALRLNVKRCLVSLIDSNKQIILAEATKSLSLVNDKRHAPEDNIWLGRVSLPRKDCVDEHVFGSSYTAQDADGQEYTAEAFVVPDMLQDERFKHRSYVTADKGVKFYAGVPIITKSGHRIGAYAVSDTKPRPHGLTTDELMFMQDASQTVTDHLEKTKSSYDRDRGERIVRGLASFIESLSSIKHELNHPTNKAQTSDQKEADVDDTRATDPQDTTKGVYDRSRSNSSSGDGREGVGRPKKERYIAPRTKSPAHSTETSAANSADAATPMSDVRNIFKRAAHAITKSTKSDGCVFFDATTGSFFDDSLNTSLSRPGSRSRTHASGSDTEMSDGSIDLRRTTSASSLKSDLDPSSLGSDPGVTNRPAEAAKVLGAALVSTQASTLQNFALSEHDLKKCIQRYPYGKIFYLDEQGHMSSGDDTTRENTISGGGLDVEHPRRDNAKHRKKRRTRHLPQEFLNLLPGVRSVIFLPLFNYSHDRWFAGGFIWSTNRATTNPEDEMPYLKTFGSTIMSEVSSMEAVNTNRAKTTFIASISHELRSPLHGILGSLEFLEDTMTTAYQMSLVGSIETCGKTLLDTIDHLLDYAKINNLNKTANQRVSRGVLRPLKRPGLDVSGMTTSLIADVDVACLAEEVVEAVFAGQTFRKSRLREGVNPAREAADQMRSLVLDDSLSTEHAIHAGSAKFSGKVFIILDIAKPSSWWVRSTPGALRRIIMNIFGNAIKYCNQGAIEVTLQMSPRSKSGSVIEFGVKDTGRGMSKDFLQNHLFRAFSQEDSFSYGTGLGLSITKQIVDNLDGKIRVKSQKNIGTHVKVSLPVKLLDPPLNHPDEELMVSARRVTQGRSLCLLNPSQDSSEPYEGQMSRLATSMAKTCKDWFAMNFFQDTSVETDADIYLYAEPPPIEYLLEHHAERRVRGKSGKEAALLIICTNAFEAASLRAGGVSHLTNLGRIVEVLSQPVGPRKLARVLLQSLRRVDELDSASHPSLPDPSLSSDIPKITFDTVETEQRAAQTAWAASTTVYDQHLGQHRPSIDTFRWKSDPPPTMADFKHMQDDTALEFGRIKNGDLPGNIPFEARRQSQVILDSEEPPPLPSVLLVDDNAINLKLLVTFMKKIKLPYEEAVNGLDALQKFKNAEKPFNFVLMDLQMPVMNGLESTRKIREFERDAKSKSPATIIAITGVASASAQQEAFDSGMSSFLTKPVKFKALQQILETNAIAN